MTFLPAGTSTGISRRRGHHAAAPERDAVSAGERMPGRPQAPSADDWPNRSYLELGAFPTAVPCSRLHTRQVLWEWGLPALTETAELIVSEFVTNALRASGVGARARPGYDQSQPCYIGLLIAASGLQVLIGVWDSSEDPPVPRPAEPEAASGRGLLLVGALCSGWGYSYPAEEPVPAELRGKQGKLVWGLIGSP